MHSAFPFRQRVFAGRSRGHSRRSDVRIANIAIAPFNVLPFPPLDGNRIAKLLSLLILIMFVLFGLPAVVSTRFLLRMRSPSR